MIDKHPIVLSTEFQDILNHLESTNDSYLITGKAGTGKSTLLSVLRRTSQKRVAVVAPTGIAALNVKGQTIHSFFKLPPRMIMPSEVHKAKDRRLYKNMDILIIDEISMVRADLLDNIDIFLRKNREVDQPFGGVQVLLFGDMFQLPPVVATPFEREVFRSDFDSPYFFSSRVLQNFDLPMLELTQVYRQSDRHFIALLDRVRTNSLEQEDVALLNERYTKEFTENDLYVTLTSLNATANAINAKKLQALDNPSFLYQAEITGNFNPSQYPTAHMLHLKVGAQVMMVKNDIDKRFVNGTLGKVLSTAKDAIVVGLNNTQGQYQEVQVDMEEWEILKYKVDPKHSKKFTTEVVGSFKQYPLKLAWAITIHKSQGQTFDKVRIDLGRGAFEFGQTYVALSRCRTFEGIELSKPITNRDILCDQRIADFYQNKRYYW